MSGYDRKGSPRVSAPGQAPRPNEPLAPGKRTLTSQLEPIPPTRVNSEQAIARAAEKPATPSHVPAAVINALSTEQGVPVPGAAQWSEKVGADVSGARMATSTAAGDAAASIDARAFTVGSRIFFGHGNGPDIDGGGLLGHELTHVAQQQHASPPSSWDQLPFVGHGDARESAARAHDGAHAGSGDVAIARDPVPDITDATYRTRHAEEIGNGVVAYVDGLHFESGSRFVKLPAPLLLGSALLGARGAAVDAKLDGLIGRPMVEKAIRKARPMGREQVTDGDKTWVDDKLGSGPDRWFPDVAVEIGIVIAGAIRQSLTHIVPRYTDAAVAKGLAAESSAKATLTEHPKPATTEIVASSPMDALVIATLVQRATFDFAAFHAANPGEKGQLGKLQRLTLCWETPRNGTCWVRATPADDPKGSATVESVAAALFGSPTQSGELSVASPPLFGLNSAYKLLPQHQATLTAMGADITRVGDVVAEAGKGPLADEIAKGQGTGASSKAATRNDVVRTIDENLAILTTIDKGGAVFGMGKNPALDTTAALRAKLMSRRAAVLAGNDAAGLAWAGQAENQQNVLTGVSFGLERHGKRLADLTRMVTDAKVKVGGFNLPDHVRDAMLRVAMRYCAAAAASDLPQTAAGLLAEAENDAGQLRIEFLEGTLAAIQRAIDDERQGKRKEGSDWGSYGVDDMRTREEQLKVRLARLRHTLQTDAGAAETELAEIQKLVTELQTETEMVTNMDQLDQAWQSMEDSLNVWFSSLGTQLTIRSLQEAGNAFHARWTAIFKAWKSGDPAQRVKAKTDLDALRADPKLREYFGKVLDACKGAQREVIIGKVIAMLAITVVTVGVGDLVVAGAAGWELSAGATAAVAGGAEAVTFTVLSQVFLDDHHGAGHIGYELATNWAMFGVMRRFAIFAEVAKLGKISAIGGQTLILAATTYAKADLDKLIQEGRHLNNEEIQQIALQGMAMAIAMHAVAPMTKPLFAELEGSAYAFTSKLKANNVTQRALTTSAEALKGTRDFSAARKYVSTEKAWLEERLKILDEVEAQAKREEARPPKDGGIASKIKMSASDLGSLRTELQGNLAKVSGAELPLIHLEPEGPGLFKCPREHIAEVTKALGDVAKVETNPDTGVKTYEVKLPDGQLVKVMEKLDPAMQWVSETAAKLSGSTARHFQKVTANKPPAEALARFRELGIEQADLQRMSALFEDGYLNSLSDAMRSRYERFIDDVFAGKVRAAEAREHLAVLEEAKTLRTHLQGAVTGDAGARLNIGQRNVAHGAFDIKVPNGKIVADKVVSVSGKGTSTAITDATGPKVDGFTVVPEIGKAAKVTKPTEARAFHDSERKIFESILGQLQSASGMTLEVGKSYQGKGFSGTIDIRTEMLPCDSCADVMANQFKAMFGSDITVTVEYGVTYP